MTILEMLQVAQANLSANGLILELIAKQIQEQVEAQTPHSPNGPRCSNCGSPKYAELPGNDLQCSDCQEIYAP